MLLCLSLCLSVSLLSGFYLFLFYLHLSLSLQLTLYYASLSNHVIWHFSSVFSLSVFSSMFSFYLSGFSSLHPSLLVCQPPPLLSLSLCSDFCSLQLAPLCSVTLPERTHIHIHTRTQLHADTPWLRLAGLFELCSIALRDCVRLCMRHVWCMFVCAHMLMGMCACLHVWQRAPLEVWNRGFEAAVFVMGLWI